MPFWDKLNEINIEDIDFDDMKKILYDIPTVNWALKRISYTVKR